MPYISVKCSITEHVLFKFKQMLMSLRHEEPNIRNTLNIDLHYVSKDTCRSLREVNISEYVSRLRCIHSDAYKSVIKTITTDVDNSIPTAKRLVSTIVDRARDDFDQILSMIECMYLYLETHDFDDYVRKALSDADKLATLIFWNFESYVAMLKLVTQIYEPAKCIVEFSHSVISLRTIMFTFSLICDERYNFTEMNMSIMDDIYSPTMSIKDIIIQRYKSQEQIVLKYEYNHIVQI